MATMQEEASTSIVKADRSGRTRYTDQYGSSAEFVWILSLVTRGELASSSLRSSAQAA
jgi:hypothetical protein